MLCSACMPWSVSPALAVAGGAVTVMGLESNLCLDPVTACVRGTSVYILIHSTYRVDVSMFLLIMHHSINSNKTCSLWKGLSCA